MMLGLFEGTRGFHGGLDLAALGDPNALQAVRVSQLHEVGALDGRRHVSAAVEELLLTAEPCPKSHC